ncbi:MAG: energy transducer TonB [Bryobacteraceae bacterium]
MRIIAAGILLSLFTYGQSAPVAGSQTTIPPEVLELLIIKRVAPKLSKQAKKLNADLLVSVELDETGKLQHFDFISGPDELRQPTATTLPEWKFGPYTPAGVGVPVKSALLLSFGVGSRISKRGTPIVERDDVRGMLRSKPRPRYPDEAKMSRTQGTVLVKALVSAQGRVLDAVVMSGPDMLRRSALDAVRLWEFVPLVRNGRATVFETDIEVNYALQ